MNSELALNSERLHDIALRCYDSIQTASSKGEALQTISSIASAELGEYFGSNILINPDEISVNFIELLDQIVFEIEENTDDNSIRDYVIDDLYLRISIYLDIFKNKEIYKRNINNRMITYEDTIIIKQYQIEEYVPELITEFFEQPALQKSIMRSLISFDLDILLNFYYQIAKDEVCFDIFVLALIGLKKYSSTFNCWDLLKTDNNKNKDLIEYVETFNLEDINNNRVPQDIYSLLFLVNYIELNIDILMRPGFINWIINIVNIMPKIDLDNSFISNIYTAISNILIYVNLDKIKHLLNGEEYVIAFIYLLDFFPREFFDRISAKLLLLGEEFETLARGLVSAGKIELHESESNIMSYLIWNNQIDL